MSALRCDRAALVEALLDRRLGPTEQAATERHLKSCTSCSELKRKLISIQATLRSASTAIEPLEHERARLALLRQSVTSSSRRPRPSALIVAGLLLLPVAAWAAVSPASPLRLVGRQPARTAPDTPTRSAIQRKPSAAAPTTPVAPAPSEASADTPQTSSAPLPAAATPTHAHRPRVTAASVDASRASRDFAQAMTALALGDFTTSASKLRGFAATYPHDARVEDAVYLEAIALERAGRSTEARSAAERYLTRFPDGAHRAQARRILAADSAAN